MIDIDGSAPEALSASPTVFCHPSLGSGEARTQVCCEEIVITAGRDAVSRIPGAVQSLLLPDLPVYIFHQGSVSLSDPVIKNLVEAFTRSSSSETDLPADYGGAAFATQHDGCCIMPMCG